MFSVTSVSLQSCREWTPAFLAAARGIKVVLLCLQEDEVKMWPDTRGEAEKSHFNYSADLSVEEQDPVHYSQKFFFYCLVVNLTFI